jgi:hypothetical protein
MEENNIQKNLKPDVEKVLKYLIIVILCGVIVMTIFVTGVLVGQEKARYSFAWVENYQKNFAGPVPMQEISGTMQSNQVISGHGIFGQVLKVDGETLVVKGQDNMEKTVNVSDDTPIVKNRSKAKHSELKVGSNVVIIGEPDDDGQVEAKFIRILPKPESYIIPCKYFMMENAVPTRLN